MGGGPRCASQGDREWRSGRPTFRLPDRCRAAAPLVNEGILLKVAANPLSCIHHNIQNWDGIPVVAR